MALAGRKATTMPVMSFLLLFPVFLHCHVRVVSQFVYPAERSQGEFSWAVWDLISMSATNLSDNV
jgi:hypothetical protein